MVRRPDHVVIDAGGVGYRLTVSAETLKAVPAAGSETFLHAELVAREDSLALFGFASEEERDLFGQLVSVSGVGPKVAIVELREKVAGALEEEVVLGATEEGDPRSLARDGLVNLGYAPLEAEQLLDGIDGGDAEELLATALRKAGAGRKAA